MAKLLYLFDLMTGDSLKELKGHSSLAMQCIADPVRQIAISVSMDNIAILWSLKTGEILRSIPNLGSGMTIRSTLFLQNGIFAVGCSEGSIQLWNLSIWDPPEEKKDDNNSELQNAYLKSAHKQPAHGSLASNSHRGVTYGVPVLFDMTPPNLLLWENVGYHSVPKIVADLPIRTKAADISADGSLVAFGAKGGVHVFTFDSLKDLSSSPSSSPSDPPPSSSSSAPAAKAPAFSEKPLYSITLKDAVDLIQFIGCDTLLVCAKSDAYFFKIQSGTEVREWFKRGAGNCAVSSDGRYAVGSGKMSDAIFWEVSKQNLGKSYLGNSQCGYISRTGDRSCVASLVGKIACFKMENGVVTESHQLDHWSVAPKIESLGRSNVACISGRGDKIFSGDCYGTVVMWTHLFQDGVTPVGTIVYVAGKEIMSLVLKEEEEGSVLFIGCHDGQVVFMQSQ